jgi:hypothetical protein
LADGVEAGGRFNVVGHAASADGFLASPPSGERAGAVSLLPVVRLESLALLDAMTRSRHIGLRRAGVQRDPFSVDRFACPRKTP